MATAMTMIPTEPATQALQLQSADEYRRELMIDYAWKAYQYVITPAEADEIIFEGLWEGVDDFVEYMWDANVGQAVSGTTNVEHGMKVYSLEELDLMDAALRAGSGSSDEGGSEYDSDEEYEYVYDSEESEVTEEEYYEDVMMRLQAELEIVGESFRGEDVDSSTAVVIAVSEDFEAEFDAEDEKEPLPLYTTDSPPAYPEPLSPGPPPSYTSLEEDVVEAVTEEAEEVETLEVIEEIVEEVKVGEVEEPATPAEVQEEDREDIPSEVSMAESAPLEKKVKTVGVFAALGARLDRAILKAKSGVVRGFRVFSSRKKGLWKPRRYSSSSWAESPLIQ